jgi:hypothetical protein
MLALVLGLESKVGIFSLLAGVWGAEAPGCCEASVDELGVVLCNKAFNESLIVGVSVYHIERDLSGVGIPEPCWGNADTVVSNEISLALWRSSLDHSIDEESEKRDTTSSSWPEFVLFQKAISCMAPTSIQTPTSVTQSKAVTIR